MNKIQLEMSEQEVRNIISYLEFGVGLRTKLPTSTRKAVIKMIQVLENKMVVEDRREDFTFSSNNKY